MARRGGYQRDQAGIEWVKTSLTAYGEAIRSSGDMQQDLYTWMNDAIAHHAYRCEQLQAQARYQHDQAEATRANAMTVDPLSPKYQVTRPKPTITRAQGAGQGAAAAAERSPRRAQ